MYVLKAGCVTAFSLENMSFLAFWGNSWVGRQKDYGLTPLLLLMVQELTLTSHS